MLTIMKNFNKKDLPDAPGIYFFKKGDDVLYIGRATSLMDRVSSYFSNDLAITRGPIVARMVEEADRDEHIQTDSVLEAVILESNLIKKYYPNANTADKDDKSFSYVAFTDEDFPRILTVRGKDLESGNPGYKIKHIFGPYTQGAVLREGMRIIRKIFTFRDKCVPVSEKSGTYSKSSRPCFNRQIGLCPGVCTGEINKRDYAKIIRNIRLFFEGKKNILLRSLCQDMRNYAKNQEFEKAESVKRTIFALEHVQDISLIKHDDDLAGAGQRQERKDTRIFRMEGYDVAHMAGRDMGGVMVVMEDKHVKKSDYRLFKIRRQKGPDDTAALEETLLRRFGHNEWPFPDVVVVDGGVAQRNTALRVIKNKGINAEVFSVVKNDRHKPLKILGNENLARNFKKEILIVNSEAHRFAIKYHRKIRKIIK